MTIRNNTLHIAHIVITSRTASEWTSSNPVLLSGELGYETDTQKMKIGNGASVWANLEYLDSGIQALITNLTTRTEYLEELAEAIMTTTSKIMNNIMKGEINQ